MPHVSETSSCGETCSYLSSTTMARMSQKSDKPLYHYHLRCKAWIKETPASGKAVAPPAPRQPRWVADSFLG